MDLFYHFEKSAKQKKECHEIQKFTGTTQLKIIKHSKTCWLSLAKVVQRTIQLEKLYNVPFNNGLLFAYFDRLSEHDSARVLRLQQHFRFHLTKLVLYFLEFALDSISKFTLMSNQRKGLS